MTKLSPVSPALGPLETYGACFDDLFSARAQPQAFCLYLEGLLLPAERTKTLTALANTEPVNRSAAQEKAQSLHSGSSQSLEVGSRTSKLAQAQALAGRSSYRSK